LKNQALLIASYARYTPNANIGESQALLISINDYFPFGSTGIQ